jgi:hypothetical protein
VLECCALSELHSATVAWGAVRAEHVWKGLFRSSSSLTFAKPIYRPFGAGTFFKPVPGVETPDSVLLPLRGSEPLRLCVFA